MSEELKNKSLVVSEGIDEISVYQVGVRLQITADIDMAGLKKLQILLIKYEDILELMNEELSNGS